ncbi:hypothetical protein BLNAU_5131 [Blattamonas nauphoetae]|uniref:Uncharacterized protein n=1 Tax=Blattamonas nauphoetae TaxID=2049346 RepID=A0ABQ9Y8A9_9EUKA|nr:hypothetical protein BLNAU_5131 [Blattamonas nauphoetae]
MINIVTELFGAYLSRLSTQIGQIQLLWTTKPEQAMLLDTNTGGTDASKHLDVATLTTQISATCEALTGLSHLFSSAVFWENKLNEMVTLFDPIRQKTNIETLLAFGVPNLTHPIAFIVNKILVWKDADYSSLLKSGLIEVLFRYVITQGIDDKQTETTLLQIANCVLYRGEKVDSKYNKQSMIERAASHRLFCLLVQSQFVEMMESRTLKRAEEWTIAFRALRSRCSKLKMSYSELPSPTSACSIDCIPFLRWYDNQERSWFGQTVVFQSLVATLKLQPALDVSLETKAVTFLESMSLSDEESAVDLLSAHVSHSDGSLTDFVQSIVTLISSPNRGITKPTLGMLNVLICKCSAESLLALVKADLIGQIIAPLNPLSLSLTDAVDIHTILSFCITNSVSLATQTVLSQLKVSDENEQQAAHETVRHQVLTPLKQYLFLLCMNHFSIFERELSRCFLLLLAWLVEMCPFDKRTLELVLDSPVFLTIPSCLTFFENDQSIWYFQSEMVDNQREWNKKGGEVQHMGEFVHRVLRMEGIDDVIEERLMNDRSSDYANRIVVDSIEWSNMLGMNSSRQ